MYPTPGQGQGICVCFLSSMTVAAMHGAALLLLVSATVAFGSKTQLDLIFAPYCYFSMCLVVGRSLPNDHMQCESSIGSPFQSLFELQQSANWSQWVDLTAYPQFNFEGPAAMANEAAEYMECLQHKTPTEQWTRELVLARSVR